LNPPNEKNISQVIGLYIIAKWKLHSNWHKEFVSNIYCLQLIRRALELSTFCIFRQFYRGANVPLSFVSMQGKKTRNNRGCSVFYSCMACTNQYGTADLTYLTGNVHGTWRNKHDPCLIVTYSSVFFYTFFVNDDWSSSDCFSEIPFNACQVLKLPPPQRNSMGQRLHNRGWWWVPSQSQILTHYPFRNLNLSSIWIKYQI
jgi:hypothetical protein